MSTYPFWLGGVAATMAACCTHPLDLAKVRMQTISSIPGQRQPTAIIVLRSSIQISGIRSVYTGISASIMRQMSYSLVRLGVYENLKQKLTDGGKRKAEAWRLIVAAGVAGGLGGIAGNPADILLVRMTSDLNRPHHQRYHYRNAATGLFTLLHKEGLNGLRRGIGANTVRAMLMNISQVGSYDYAKQTLLHAKIPGFDYQFQDNLVLHTISSGFAGFVATTICSPADVLKSRLMSASGNAKPLDILKESLRQEGVSFLFKGWTPAFIRLGPNTVLMFIFFEQLKKTWKTLQEESAARYAPST